MIVSFREQDTLLDHSPYSLSDSADCLCPDSADSPGAKFLFRIESTINEFDFDDLVEKVRDVGAEDAAEHFRDSLYEAVDGDVPIYTHTIWQAFVDLGGYQEDDDTGSMAAAVESGGDLTKVAQIALYQIGERLGWVLLQERCQEIQTLLGDEPEEVEDDEPVDPVVPASRMLPPAEQKALIAGS